jgi:hypothetical protein
MFTTDGDTFFATSRNVLALTVPVSGALFMGGAVTVWAVDAGDRPNRDASTMPTSNDVSTAGTR